MLRKRACGKKLWVALQGSNHLRRNLVKKKITSESSGSLKWNKKIKSQAIFFSYCPFESECLCSKIFIYKEIRTLTGIQQPICAGLSFDFQCDLTYVSSCTDPPDPTQLEYFEHFRSLQSGNPLYINPSSQNVNEWESLYHQWEVRQVRWPGVVLVIFRRLRRIISFPVRLLCSTFVTDN